MLIYFFCTNKKLLCVVLEMYFFIFDNLAILNAKIIINEFS